MTMCRRGGSGMGRRPRRWWQRFLCLLWGGHEDIGWGGLTWEDNQGTHHVTNSWRCVRCERIRNAER